MPVLMVSHGPYKIPSAPVGVPPSILVGSTVGAAIYDPDSAAWSYPSSGPTGVITAIAAIAPDLWAADDGPALWHSGDTGANWSSVALPSGSGSVDAMQAVDGVLYLVRNGGSSGDNGIWSRPVDGSGSWTHLFDSGTDTISNAGASGTRLWFGQNDGSAWAFKYQTPIVGGSVTTVSGATVDAGDTVVINGDPSDDTVAYIAAGFDSTPGPPQLFRVSGSSASDIAPAGLSAGAFDAFLDVNSNGSVLVAFAVFGSLSDTGRVYRSDDAGANWTVTLEDVNVGGGRYPPNVSWVPGSATKVAVNWNGPDTSTGVNCCALSGDGGATWSFTADFGSSIDALVALS